MVIEGKINRDSSELKYKSMQRIARCVPLMAEVEATRAAQKESQAVLASDPGSVRGLWKYFLFEMSERLT
jgi:hypothetical protein